MEARIRTAVPPVLGVLAAVTYSDYLVDVVLRPDGVDQLAIMSHLEAPGAPYAVVLRAFDVAAGVFAIALAPFLSRALPHGWWRWVPVGLLVVFGISGALTGLIPDPCPDPASGCGGASGAAQRSVHVLLSGVADVSLLLCPLAVVIGTWRRGPHWVPVASGAAFALIVLSSVLYRWHSTLDPSWPTGLSQRLVVSSGSVWLVLVGVIGARARPTTEAAPPSPPEPRPRHAGPG